VIALIVSAPLAGRPRALLPIARRKRQDAHGGAVSLFRMRPVAHQALDQDGGVGPDFGGPSDQGGRRRDCVTLMRLRHVGVDGDMTGALRTTDMAGDALVIVEDLDHPMGEPDLDGAAYQPMRHRIKGLFDLDMVVGMDLR